MNIRLTSTWIILLLVVVLFSACSGGSSEREPATADAPAAESTPEPETATIATTATPSSAVAATPATIPSPSPTTTTIIAAQPGSSPTAVETVPPAATPTGAANAEGAGLIEALRGGGHVIYFRHAATDWAQSDSDRVNLENCATQRNLTDEGRSQARSIGVAFQQLGIPVGQVFSSEYCRARETAQLAFRRAETTSDLSGLSGLSDEERRRRLDALRQMLATAPEPGANTILVAHQFNLRDAVDVNLSTEGEAAIFKPEGEGFSLVGRILPDEWLQLSAQINGPAFQEYPVPAGSRPHDVAPAPDGTVWYTAQGSGQLGRLDPVTGETRHIPLGAGSAPHGVIVGPDGAPWVTDGGLNAIVRVDPATDEVRVFPLPQDRPGANLNTAAFDANGILWFTGQAGVYGRLDPASGELQVFDAPEGRGPYGISATPDGTIFYASLAGSHIARIDPAIGQASVIEPPTPEQGARRVWADSQGRVWVSEWNAGQVAVYDPATGSWREWRLPGDNPQAYAVYVDQRDIVWLSDFGANALVRFDPATERFEVFPLPSSPANVRQLLGRPGEVWGAESGVDKIVVLRVAR